MRRATYLFFTLYLFLLPGACGTEEKPADEIAPEEKPQVDPDSLRRAYQRLMVARKDPLPTEQIVETGKLYPVDEAPRDTLFFVFRENLLNAVNNKNIFGVMEIVDENIQTGVDGENGLAAFATTWGLETEEKTKQSELWPILKEVLEQGGTFGNNRHRFVAPYVYSSWPDNYDALTHAAITGAGVRLRDAPGLNSRTKTMVSHDIVELLETTDQTETIDGETHPWIRIKTLGGTEGYVWGKFVQRPTGFRAGFERHDENSWKMVFLVAGD
jgi:hypothetical protein